MCVGGCRGGGGGGGGGNELQGGGWEGGKKGEGGRDREITGATAGGPSILVPFTQT